VDYERMAKETVLIHKARESMAFILRCSRDPKIGMVLLTPEKCSSLARSINSIVFNEGQQIDGKLNPERVPISNDII